MNQPSTMRLACVALAAGIVAGCQWPYGGTAGARPGALPFEQLEVAGAGFSHTVLKRAPTAGRTAASPGTPAFVYFEGDGRPWNSSGTAPSANPDPLRPLAVELAATQEGPVYVLGRPCYFGRVREAGCSEALWTSGRYSEVVVASTSAALRQLLTTDGMDSAVLIGYSGGGSLALLVAERVPEVKAVVTIAANLDLEAWTRHHGYLPLTGSLDPLSAATLHPGCEIHIAGTRDTTVPLAQLRQATARRPGAILWTEPGADHACCWTRRWSDLMARVRNQLDSAGCLAAAP